MALPHFTNLHASTFNDVEYLKHYEALIMDDTGFEFLFENPRDISFINGSLIILRDFDDGISNDYITKYFRQHKLNILLETKNGPLYRILTHEFDKQGHLLRTTEFMDVEFKGSTDKAFHFSYNMENEKFL